MSFFNNPVKVPVFQAAITGLVERLIRKAGKVGTVSIQVLFVGAQACVMYSERGGNIRGTLKLPALKEGATITREKANRWVAYTIHEVWHVIFTDGDVWNNYAISNPGLRKLLANALEDARIERSGMELGYADGFKVVGRDLLGHMLVTGGMDVNPNDPAQIPWVFAIGCRGYGVPGEKRLLSALDPRIAVILAKAKAQVDAIPASINPMQGTMATCRIATEVYEALKLLGKEPQPKQPPPVNPQPPRPPQDEEGEEGEGGEGGEGKGKPPNRSNDDAPDNPDTDEREAGDADDETYDDERDPQDGPQGEGEGEGGDDDGEWEAPLRVGDKVICPDGTKGTIAAVDAEGMAEVTPL